MNMELFCKNKCHVMSGRDDSVQRGLFSKIMTVQFLQVQAFRDRQILTKQFLDCIGDAD